MSAEWFIGFANGVNRHTCNLASAAWVIYSLLGQLFSSSGAFLGPAANNMAEYMDFIELIWDDSSCGITCLEVRLESQLVVSQLNGDYHV